MKIRDVEVEFDFLDADDVEKFENEAKKVVEKCKNKNIEQMSHADALREECNIIEDFFRGIFNNETVEKMFKGKKNLADHIMAFEDIVNMKNEKQQDLQRVFDRYKPREDYKYKGKR